MAVAQAGQEVKSHVGDHDAWVAVTSDRLAPLLQSQANAVMSKNGALEQIYTGNTRFRLIFLLIMCLLRQIHSYNLLINILEW